MKFNVGCGLNVVPGYANLDNSVSVLIQRNLCLRAVARIIESLLGREVYTRFPGGVIRWDVTRGFPSDARQVQVIYSSHMLEHLSRRNAEKLLRDAYRVLQPGGILRIAVPDLERKARGYLASVNRLRNGVTDVIPCDDFIRSTLLGIETTGNVRHPVDVYRILFNRQGHSWMWDGPSLVLVLRAIGFVSVAERSFRDSAIPEIDQLESESRREESIYVEAGK